MPEFLITYVLQPVDSPNSDVFAKLYTGESVPKESIVVVGETSDDALVNFFLQDIEKCRQTGRISVVAGVQAQ